jgi:hypothetical protein
MSLRANDSGYLVLADDGTFYLVWLYSDTTPGLHVATNTGRYARAVGTRLHGFDWPRVGGWGTAERCGDVSL